MCGAQGCVRTSESPVLLHTHHRVSVQREDLRLLARDLLDRVPEPLRVVEALRRQEASRGGAGGPAGRSSWPIREHSGTYLSTVRRVLGVNLAPPLPTPLTYSRRIKPSQGELL